MHVSLQLAFDVFPSVRQFLYYQAPPFLVFCWICAVPKQDIAALQAIVFRYESATEEITIGS